MKNMFLFNKIDFYSSLAHFGEFVAVFKGKEVENRYVSGYLKVYVTYSNDVNY